LSKDELIGFSYIKFIGTRYVETEVKVWHEMIYKLAVGGILTKADLLPTRSCVAMSREAMSLDECKPIIA
jgi:hypothetical protein